MKAILAVSPIALACALIFVLTETVRSEEKRLPSKDEVLKQLQGTWTCVADQSFGRVATKAEMKLQNRRVTIVDNKFTMTQVKGGHFHPWEGRIDIKPAVPFGEFTFYGRGHDGNYIERIGIYQLDGDTLRICYGNPAHKAYPTRATKFETTQAEGRESFVLKRDAE